MKLRLFSPHIVLALLANLLLAGTSLAWFSFGDDDKGKSGIDFNRGYDINTVVTVTGRVVTTPLPGDGGNIVFVVKNGAEAIHISVGPPSYWDKNGIQVRLNDEITAKGSTALGKDGNKYLLGQKIDNRTNGSQVNLRNAKGEPAWIGGTTGRPADGATGMMGNRGIMRRGGGMMHGGGGMMHR